MMSQSNEKEVSPYLRYAIEKIEEDDIRIPNMQKNLSEQVQKTNFT